MAQAGDLLPVIDGYRERGIMSAAGIAKALNGDDIKAPRGGRWQAGQVRRLLQKLPTAA